MNTLNVSNTIGKIRKIKVLLEIVTRILFNNRYSSQKSRKYVTMIVLRSKFQHGVEITQQYGRYEEKKI